MNSSIYMPSKVAYFSVGSDELLRRREGICHLWSRGRHFSPSLPVVGRASESLARSCESDLRAEISGESSRYGAQATRPEVPPPIPNFVVRFPSSACAQIHKR